MLVGVDHVEFEPVPMRRESDELATPHDGEVQCRVDQKSVVPIQAIPRDGLGFNHQNTVPIVRSLGHDLAVSLPDDLTHRLCME